MELESDSDIVRNMYLFLRSREIYSFFFFEMKVVVRRKITCGEEEEEEYSTGFCKVDLTIENVREPHTHTHKRTIKAKEPPPLARRKGRKVREIAALLLFGAFVKFRP